MALISEGAVNLARTRRALGKQPTGRNLLLRSPRHRRFIRGRKTHYCCIPHSRFYEGGERERLVKRMREQEHGRDSKPTTDREGEEREKRTKRQSFQMNGR